MRLGLTHTCLITNPEGDSWLWQRRLAQPVFHQRRINGYARAMVDYAEQMLVTWRDRETRDVHAEMMRLTLRIVMKTIFNAEVDEGEAKTVANVFQPETI